MKKTLLVSFIAILLISTANAQNGFSFSCTRDTTIDCAQSCISLKALIPDVHAYTDDYGVNSLTGPGGCFRPPVNPGIPGTSTNLDQDDRYTPVIPMPFDFPFYGIIYAQLVVNTNGIISFDLANASTGAQWIIQGLSGTLPSSDYDRAIIMGAFHDIDIGRPNSPTRQIKYDVTGTAPHRKWVLSFYKVPCFQCNNLINNTYEITLYEGLGLVEVHVFGRDVCTTWNAGAAMIGMQNYDLDKGIMAPGRDAFTTPRWQGANMNEGWRFTPKVGPSLFKNVVLTNLAGDTVANGTTAPGANNDLAVTFDNICPAATTTYLVRSAYYHFEYPFQFPVKDSIIYGVDTITVYKNGSIPAVNVRTTPAACGPNPNGTITVNNPVGPNYEYSIDGGGTYQPTNTFTVLPGTYTVTIHDVTGTCTKDTTVIVGSPATFTATAVSVKTSCPTSSDGTITVTPSTVAPGYTFEIDGSGVFVASNVFTNQSAGDHNISVKDAGGCVYGFVHTVLSNPGFTTTASSTNATCTGVANGTITVDVPPSGQVPFTYQVGNNSQLSNAVFNGLLGDSTYQVIVKDFIGCADTFTHTLNSNPGVTVIATPISASCLGVNNGKIALAASGGTAPYFYDTTSTNSFVALDSIRNLAPADYIITVKDNVGCRFTTPPVTVSSGAGVRSTFEVEASACTAASTGRIVIKVTSFSGPAPYSYSLTGAPPFTAFASPVSLIDTIRNLSAANYTVTVKDAVGCIYSLGLTVGANDPGISGTIDSIATACAVATTGKIVIHPGAPGVGPFSYDLDNAGFVLLTDTLRNLDTGFHRVVLKDALGCNITFNPEILVGPGVNARDSVIISECSVASTGKIFVKTTSGIVPFQFSKDSGVTWQANIDSFANLLPATYHIGVKDAVGCSYYFNSTVGAGTGVTATDSTVKSNCATATTGKIFIKPVLGIAPFRFSKDSGATWQTNIDSFVNLLPGTYHVAIKDAVGCSYYFNSSVGIGSGVTATDSTVKSNCAIVSTGKIYVKPGLGVPPFQFSNDSGSVYKFADSFVTLSPGLYRIAVKDAVGCIYHFNSTVGIGAGVTAADSVIVSECATATTGKIFIKPGLGVAPFRFSSDSGVSWQAKDSFVNLAPRVYPIAVQDAVGCIYYFNSTVGTGAGVRATASAFNSACLGVSTGRIVITPTSGTSPYTYTIGSGGPLALDTIRNLASGNYNIVLSDAVGCSYNVPAVTVNNNIGVTASFTPVKSACAGAATGAIIVKPLTGTAVFRYSLDGGATFQYDSVFRNLASNAYNIKITDTLGCVLNSPVQNVTDNPGVVTNPSTIQNSSCASIPNGTITVNVTAGILPLTYKMISPVVSAPQAGNQFTSLFSGPYDITITDSAGCTKTITPVVGNNPKVQIDSFNVVRPACKGLLNGTIKVNVSLGVPPYEYAIDTNPYGSSKVFSSVGAGVHTLHIKDANNCSIDSTITITEPNLLTASIVSTTKATCSGNPDGKIIAAAAGGTSPYQYTLDVAGLAAYQSAVSFDVLKGNYKVTVKDDKGCKATVDVVIDSVFTMYLDLGNETTICSGANLILNPNTNPETSIFTYSPKGSLDNETLKNPSATPTDTTTYTLTAQWGLCKLSDNVKVNVLRKPVPDAGSDVVICFDTTTELRASASNLSGTVNYTWSPASLIDGKADTTVITARPKELLTYYTVTVTDNYNCGFAVADSVLVNMLPPVYAFAGNDTNAVLNTPHQLTATGAGIGGSYEWFYPSDVSISDNLIANPTAIFEPVPGVGTYHPDTNYYKLSVRATNLAGCSATDTIKINVFIGPTCYVPNAFSPNGDNMNDVFRPVPVGINIEYFRVFNRYGEVVYETSRFLTGWDGIFKGKPQPVGAYVWVFKGKDKKGREIVNNGTVMLVR